MIDLCAACEGWRRSCEDHGVRAAKIWRMQHFRPECIEVKRVMCFVWTTSALSKFEQVFNSGKLTGARGLGVATRSSGGRAVMTNRRSNIGRSTMSQMGRPSDGRIFLVARDVAGIDRMASQLLSVALDCDICGSWAADELSGSSSCYDWPDLLVRIRRSKPDLVYVANDPPVRSTKVAKTSANEAFRDAVAEHLSGDDVRIWPFGGLCR